MKKPYKVPIAAAALLSAMSAYATYSRTETNEWFSVEVSSQTLSESTWTKPTSGEAAITGGKLVTDVDIGDSIIYTPTGTGKSIQTFYLRLVANPWLALPTPSAFPNDQAAICALKSGDTLAWYALATVDNVVTWVALQGATPTADAEYELRLDADGLQTPKKLAFSVRAVGASEFTELTYNDNHWFTAAKPSGAAISYVAFSGEGTLAISTATTSSRSIPSLPARSVTLTMPRFR